MTDRGGMPGQSKLWHESKRVPTSREIQKDCATQEHLAP